MVTTTQLKQFQLIFKGKSDTYVKNIISTSVANNEVKCKSKITQVRGNVDDSVLLSHFSGAFGVGICPVDMSGKCFFGVIDIDYYKQVDLIDLLSMLGQYQIPLVPCRSKSGGLHLYFFVRSAVQARTMRDTLQLVVQALALKQRFGETKVEIFPKQDTIQADGFGSCITLPYFNEDNTAVTYAVDYLGNKIELKDFLLNASKNLSSIDSMKLAIDSLPYNDAPPCLQTILVNNLVGSEDSGRNNFLFSYAIYAEKKNGDSFADDVKALNSKFEYPLTQTQIDSIVNSVSGHTYSYRCKDIPCCSYCNKTLCKQREFGLGQAKGHFTNIVFGQLYRMLAAEPYYIWELKTENAKDFKRVTIKNEDVLLDQKSFIKLCTRYLNFAPLTVKTNDWLTTVNKSLQSIKEVAVSLSSDTSRTARLFASVKSYLVDVRGKDGCDYLIKAGMCIAKAGKVYFTVGGLIEYLQAHRVPFDDALLREQLITFGATEAVFEYVSPAGIPNKISCWSKVEDASMQSCIQDRKEVSSADALGIDLTEATNAPVYKGSEEKLYSEEDIENAKDLF
jgi:hypothetical protein